MYVNEGAFLFTKIEFLKGHCHAIVESLQKAKTCQPIKNNGEDFLPRTILLH